MNATTLPQLDGQRLVTDGGMETDLIFHHGVELPEFAAFPLLDSVPGRERLRDYYAGYADIARASGSGLLLESPTWRANPDWGARVGYGAAGLDRVNRFAITWLAELRAGWSDLDPVLVSGMIGPRGDGYASGDAPDPDEAEEYHAAQLRSFAAAGADLAGAYTLTDTGEAIGIVRAARAVGLPVAISFTVETDSRLPSGRPLADAVEAVDSAAPPDYFLVNCAHPSHVLPGLDTAGGWRERIVGIRANASTLSHAELDDAETLDEGDLAGFAAAHAPLVAALPALSILGGCCGTDSRHVAALVDATWR